MDAVADVVAELLDHLGVNERVAVGGVSMGGYAALAFARLYPQRLRALILADTKADPDDEPARANRDRQIQAVTEHGPGAILEQLMPRLVGPTTLAGRAPVVQTVRDLAGRQSGEGLAAALKALRDRPDAGPGLPHIAVPTLVVVGDQDAITPPDKARTLAAAIPNARLVTIADAGHLSNLEHPEPFTAAVRGFLDSLPDEGSPARTV
jgi:pimeloyl-ACP methyl ester carboxylesterase